MYTIYTLSRNLATDNDKVQDKVLMNEVPKNWQSLRVKTQSASCNVSCSFQRLLLRDEKIAKTLLHSTFLMSSLHIKHFSLINIF